MKGETIDRGRATRDRLVQLLTGKELLIRTQKDRQEKYGRYLCEILAGPEKRNVNELLMEEGLAVPYMRDVG